MFFDSFQSDIRDHVLGLDHLWKRMHLHHVSGFDSAILLPKIISQFNYINSTIDSKIDII